MNPKAYFRRSAGYEGKRDFDKALLDVKKAQELMDVEDKVSDQILFNKLFLESKNLHWKLWCIC